VGPGPARKLIILRQPSSTATAGQTFAQQPQVGLQDQFGNFCSSDNSTVVGASRGSGTGTLQGTTTATAIGGTVTFTDLSYPVAETMKVPLYMMSAGDLGIKSHEVEINITNILEMVAKWNAVLLLDECDVFLEARSKHDLERTKSFRFSSGH